MSPFAFNIQMSRPDYNERQWGQASDIGYHTLVNIAHI